MNTTTFTRVVVIGATVLFFVLATDGRLHWDEPAYLYSGAFLSTHEILSGGYQPSGIDSFYISRVLHVLLIHGITQLTGPGMVGFYAVILTYFAMLLLTLIMAYRLLKLLQDSDPTDSSGLKLAVAVACFSPIFLYLSFKTLPEIPALLFVVLASYALLKAMLGHPLIWLSLSALCLAATALTKNTMIILYVSLVLSMLVCQLGSFRPLRLILYSTLSGCGSLILFFGFLQATGISLDQYFGYVDQLLKLNDSFVQRFIEGAMELGSYALFLILAISAFRSTLARFYIVWFLIATLPILLFFGRTEARYLAANVIPLIGIIAIGLRVGVDYLLRFQPMVRITAAAVVVVFLVTSDWLTLKFMEHEVNYHDIKKAVNRLDNDYQEKDNYTILTPWAYTDFHILRFMYPDHRIYSVRDYDLDRPKRPAEYVENLKKMQQQYIKPYLMASPQQLHLLDNTPVIYFGFIENFSIENIQRLFKKLSAKRALAKFNAMSLNNHLTVSWLWYDPDFELQPFFESGHYKIFRVIPIDDQSLPSPLERTRRK